MSRRIAFVDILRGLAIIGVVVFHLVWDLRYFGFTRFDPVWDPFWLSFAKVLVHSFLALVGVSLVLAHGNEVRWPAFWRRWLVLAGAAVAVSLITFFAFGEGFVYFGVLHAIAVFSVLALPFLGWPIWAGAVVALMFLLPSQFYSDPLFNQKALSWIGFFTQHPNTQDLVPFFPSFGSVMAGLVGARIVSEKDLWPRIAAWPTFGLLGAGLQWCGRHTLIIYLLHQPIAFGLVMLLAQMRPASIA